MYGVAEASTRHITTASGANTTTPTTSITAYAASGSRRPPTKTLLEPWIHAAANASRKASTGTPAPYGQRRHRRNRDAAGPLAPRRMLVWNASAFSPSATGSRLPARRPGPRGMRSCRRSSSPSRPRRSASTARSCASTTSRAQLASPFPAAGRDRRAHEPDRDRHRRHRHALREPALHGRGGGGRRPDQRRPAPARDQPRLAGARAARLGGVRLRAGRGRDGRRHGARAHEAVPGRDRRRRRRAARTRR